MEIIYYHLPKRINLQKDLLRRTDIKKDDIGLGIGRRMQNNASHPIQPIGQSYE
jgi:hypothetical protein